MAISIDLNIYDTDIQVGVTFSVDVSYFNDGTYGDLLSFGFNVDPNSSLSYINYDGYAIGPDFDDGLSDGNKVSGFFNGFSNIGDTLALVTLSFTALSAGSEVLDIIGLLSDGDGFFFSDFLAVTDFEDNIIGSAPITVNDGAPVPEPASLLLLGTGVIGLVGANRKFRKNRPLV